MCGCLLEKHTPIPGRDNSLTAWYKTGLCPSTKHAGAVQEGGREWVVIFNTLVMIDPT
jgi:hypothetical protein